MRRGLRSPRRSGGSGSSDKKYITAIRGEPINFFLPSALKYNQFSDELLVDSVKNTDKAQMIGSITVDMNAKAKKFHRIGSKYFSNGNIVEAEKYYIKALEEDGFSSEVYASLGAANYLLD